jgi:hypothetical protein
MSIWILKEQCQKMRTGFVWLKKGPVASSFEHAIKPLGQLLKVSLHYELLLSYQLVVKN